MIEKLVAQVQKWDCQTFKVRGGGRTIGIEFVQRPPVAEVCENLPPRWRIGSFVDPG